MKRRALLSFGESPEGLGGLARAARTQALLLQRLGWETGYVTPDDVSRRLSWQKFSALDQVWLSLQVSALARQGSARADVLFSHGLCGALGSKRKQVQTYHGTCAGLAHACRGRMSRLEFLSVAGGYGTCEALSGWCSQKRVAVSCSVSDEVRRFYHLRDTEVIHNVIDAQHFRGELKSAPGRPLQSLVVGRMDYGKGRQTLAKLLTDPVLGAHHQFTLAGSVQGELPPDARLTQLGMVPYSDLPAVYAASDCLLCLSRYEGFGLTMLEAWAAGRPVITTNVGIIRELRRQEESLDVLVVDDPDDGDAFRQRLELLRENPELGQRQARWGQDLVFAHFSHESVLPAYRVLLNNL